MHSIVNSSGIVYCFEVHTSDWGLVGEGIPRAHCFVKKGFEFGVILESWNRHQTPPSSFTSSLSCLATTMIPTLPPLYHEVKPRSHLMATINTTDQATVDLPWKKVSLTAKGTKGKEVRGFVGGNLWWPRVKRTKYRRRTAARESKSSLHQWRASGENAQGQLNLSKGATWRIIY